jgi:lipopolysaccharide biosynthesis protein
VVSIIKQFQGDGQLDMIAPQGTVIGPDTDASRVFPHIVRKYGLGITQSVSEVFRDNVLQMEDTFRQLFPNGFRGEGPRSIKNHELAICAGTMFWARWGALHVNALVREFPTLKVNLTTGYMINGDGGLEHTIERLFTTLIVMQNRRIGTIPPAPRPLAIYFPQYHAIPENDRFWGEGFTEWTLLRPLEVEGIRKPLSVEEGGLGYYDLMSRSIRRKQADFARKFGVNGFIFYHYWFSGSYAPDDHLVMHQVQERMLLDGEPDLPFAFSWANEVWLS